MGVLEKYFRREFQLRRFYLDHDAPTDFYLCSYQKSDSVVPLLCVRTFVFLGCLSILIASIVVTSETVMYPYWLIYLTSWGVLLITATSALALIVSLIVYIKGPIEGTGLPWYVKIYWAFYNCTIPISFFITGFYWSVLDRAKAKEFYVDPVLTVFIHAVNSALMLILLVSSRQPSRLLHIVHPLAIAVMYLGFSIAYHFAGGTNPAGRPYVYPVLNWSRLSLALTTVACSTVLLLAVHVLVVAMSVGRDRLTYRYCKKYSLDIGPRNNRY